MILWGAFLGSSKAEFLVLREKNQNWAGNNWFSTHLYKYVHEKKTQNLQPVHSVGNHLINKGSRHLIQIVLAHPENEEIELLGHEKMLTSTWALSLSLPWQGLGSVLSDSNSRRGRGRRGQIEICQIFWQSKLKRSLTKFKTWSEFLQSGTRTKGKD